MRRASKSSPPNTAPTTIPAIWPPERPDEPEAPAVEVAAGELADVVDGNRGGMVELIGKVTPTQRLVTFDPMQQESVAFGELCAQ